MSLTTDDRQEIRNIATEVVDEAIDELTKTIEQTFQELREQLEAYFSQINTLIAQPKLSLTVVEKLTLPLCSLTLSKRAHICLSKAEIYTITDLVSQTEADLKKIPNFGNMCTREVKEKLKVAGLRLGMLT